MPKKKPNIRSVTSADVLIGQRLRTRRMEQKISQAELGDELGVSFQQVQKYEKGTNRIGAVRLQQIANFLEVDVAFFMGDMGGSKLRAPSKMSTFMSTKDGIDIVEAMMQLDPPHRRSVIALARTLVGAYGAEGKA